MVFIYVCFGNSAIPQYPGCIRIDEKRKKGPNDSTVTTNNVRLPAGTYYVKVNKRPYYSFSNIDYSLSVDFTPEDQYYEKIPNEDPSTAYPINVNTTYTGNLASDNDVDFYTFTLPSLNRNDDIVLNEIELDNLKYLQKMEEILTSEQNGYY